MLKWRSKRSEFFFLVGGKNPNLCTNMLNLIEELMDCDFSHRFLSLLFIIQVFSIFDNSCETPNRQNGPLVHIQSNHIKGSDSQVSSMFYCLETCLCTFQ